MFKDYLFKIFILLLIFVLSACATGKKKDDSLVQPVQELTKEEATSQVEKKEEVKEEASSQKIDEDEATGPDLESVGKKVEDEEEKVEYNPSAMNMFNDAIKIAYIKPDEAIKMFESAVKTDPKLYKAYYNIALISEWKGDYSSAERYYLEALKLKEDYFIASENLMMLYLKMNRPQDAEKFILQQINKFKRSSKLKNALTILYIRTNRIEEARKNAMKTLKVDEKNTETMVLLARTYIRDKKFELALNILDNAKEISPNNEKIYIEYAFIYKQNNNIPAAIEMLKKAIDIRYDIPEVHNNLGVLYSQAEDYSAAIDEFKIALRYNSRYYEAKLNLANALRGEKQYEEAEKIYMALLKEKPDMYEVLFNLGILYLDMDREFENRDILQRYSDSIKYLKEYFSHIDGNSDLGKRVSKYIEEAEKKLRTKKDDIEREKKRRLKQEEDAKKRAEAEAKYKEILPEAEKAFSEKRWEDAKKLFTDCLKLLPEDQLARDRLKSIDQNIQAEAEARKRAEAEAKKREKEEAKLRAANEKKYNAIMPKADLAFKKKDYDTAQSLYTEALSYKPDSEKAKERLKEIEDILKERAAETARKAEEERVKKEAQKKEEVKKAKSSGEKIEDEEDDSANKNLPKQKESDRLPPTKSGEKIDDDQ